MNGSHHSYFKRYGFIENIEVNEMPENVKEKRRIKHEKQWHLFTIRRERGRLWYRLYHHSLPFFEKVRNKLDGHITIGKVTFFGFNAMNLTIQVSLSKGYLCFRPPSYYNGRYNRFSLFYSSNGTPQDAKWCAGKRLSNEDSYWKKALKRFVRRIKHVFQDSKENKIFVCQECGYSSKQNFCVKCNHQNMGEWYYTGISKERD